MTPEQWHRVKEVFERALERDSHQRAAFLDEACADDVALRHEVDSLIDSYEKEPSFMSLPVIAAAPSLFDKQAESLVGQMVGHYKISAAIGAGGMGEVYLAQDTRLGRQVALKLLPTYLSGDSDRLRRFEQEARAASALNHPNVCMIHEVGEMEDGRHYIVMEHIEGVTLRESLAIKPLKLREVLDVAVQVASALEAAHAAGVVHRDIKPENIMLRRDGYIKVLDFGLAKLTEQLSERQRIEPEAPTRGMVKTDVGVVMGTVAYMSPEQTRGLDIDARTDIWSLGVVLYEMVAGRVPFAGETKSDQIVSILEREPEPLARLSPPIPAELQRIISKSLRKDREERYQVVKDLLLDLKSLRHELDFEALRKGKDERYQIGRDAISDSPTTGAVKARPLVGVQFLTAEIKHHKKTAILTLAAIGCIALVVFAWVHPPRSTLESLPLMKVVPFTSYPGNEDGAAFSPDGNQIAFVWGGEKNDNFDIYVKSVGSERPLRLTSDLNFDYGPAWSPDGQKIAFVRASESEFTIFVVPALSGSERRLLSLSPKINWGGWMPNISWSPDGKFIAYCDKASKEAPPGIFLFSPETGERNSLTSPPAQYWGDFLPAFSPDGQTISFLRWNDVLSAELCLVPTIGGQPRRLTFDNVAIGGAAWTPDGREIIFSSSRLASPNFSSLWRIPIAGGAPERLSVGGDKASGPSISLKGHRLAYTQGYGDINIYRFDIPHTSGQVSSAVSFISSTRDEYAPQFSPDGHRIAFDSNRSGKNEIWMCDSDGSNLTQITSLGAWTGSARWSPDGQQIAFDSNVKGNFDIYVVSAEGGLPRRLTAEAADDTKPSWSQDGRWIYFASKRSGDNQVWKMPVEGGDAVQITRQGGNVPFESPDGKFVYYVKITTPGIWRAPVQGGDEMQVLESFNGAYFGDWALASDGIYSINPEGKDGAVVDFFSFATHQIRKIAQLGKANIFIYGFAVSPDRHSILYTQVDQATSDIMLVENFR